METRGDMEENEKPPVEEELFTIENVCETFKISRSTFYKIQDEGTFFNPPKYIGKSPRFTLEQIRNYRDSLKTVPEQNGEKVTK